MLLRSDVAMARVDVFKSSEARLGEFSEPLSRFPAIRTSSVTRFAHELEDIYGATGFELPNPTALAVRGNFVELSDIALGYGACGTPITIHFGETDFARLQLPLHGHGATRSGAAIALVGVDRPSLTSAGRPTMLDYGEGFAHLFVRIKSQSLQRKLELLLGIPVRRALEFALDDFTGQPALEGLRQLIELLVQELDDERSALSPLAVQELEQAVMLQLLFASRHNFSDLLDREPREAAPVHVRRIEAYIEANWNRPVRIEDLAEVSGVSARTLFRSFEKAHGCSPMIFAKRIRLTRVRDLLSRPDDATSVAGVALACGFSNLGHLAHDYRKQFGELPSATLSLSRLLG